MVSHFVYFYGVCVCACLVCMCFFSLLFLPWVVCFNSGLFACLFSKGREKEGIELDAFGSGEDQGEETMIRMYCIKIFSFKKGGRGDKLSKSRGASQ